MFTGIITDVGTVARADLSPGRDATFEIEAPGSSADIAIGASIAHSGVCLTVIERRDLDAGGCRWTVQASAETLALTTLGDWRAGTRVNLERSLRLGDELGGHMVAGHVDGVGEIVSIERENDSRRMRVRAPAALAAFLATKGSIAVDGVSLTVNDVVDEAGAATFGLNIIAHTWTATAFADAVVGRRVNLEADLVARYVARITALRP